MVKLQKKQVSLISYLRNLKKSKLHINKEIYKIAWCELQKLISYKKKRFFENKLDDSIGKR